jgi:phosphoglycolate phosphatase
VDSAHPALLLFDHDGVIADSFDVFCAGFLEGCRHAGFAQVATPEDVVELFEGNVYERMRELGAGDGQIREAVGRAAQALQMGAAAVRPFPLMPEVLGELGDARRLVVVTSNTAVVVEAFLRRYDIHGVAEIAGAEAGHSKVDKIRGLLARFPGDETVWYVGDTAGDMREARLAGVTPVGVAWGWHDPERLEAAGAEHVAATPVDLLAIVAPDLSADFLGVG